MGCTRGGNCPSSLSLSGHKNQDKLFLKIHFHGFRKQMWVKKVYLLKLKSCRQTSKNDKTSSKKKVATTAAMWRAVVYAVLAANRVLMGATSCYIANLFSNSSENLIPDEILYSWGSFVGSNLREQMASWMGGPLRGMEPQLRGASGIFSPKLRPHLSGFQNTTSDLNKFRSTEQNIPLSCDQLSYFNIDWIVCRSCPFLADRWEDIGMTIRSATVDPIHRITKDSFRTTFN